VRKKEKKKKKELYRLSPGDYQQSPKEKNDRVRVKVRSEKELKE